MTKYDEKWRKLIKNDKTLLEMMKNNEKWQNMITMKKHNESDKHYIPKITKNKGKLQNMI